MKDLDFDELDRAVNSLIGVTPANTTTPAPAADPATETSALTPVPPATPLVSSDGMTQPLAAKRSSGRFMDVVHPSSDMRPATTPAPVQPVSRVGASIQPIARPTPPVTTSDVPAIINTPSEDTTPQKPTTAEWPDPLDMVQTTPVEDKKDETPAVPLSGLDAEIAASLEQTSSPLESPFIADAKVEKRPLGAFSSETSTDSTITTPSEEVKDEANSSTRFDEREDHPIESDVPLPAELQNDLLSIESNESSSVFSTSPSEVNENTTVSIPQQYSEQPSTGDKPTGAIFDVEAYRKPIAKQKKKGSPWLIIVWILLLIIVGAGAGAAVYYFVLPSL